MADRLVFFTTDRGYLIPTLVAATQVVAQTKLMADVDVLVFLIEIDPSALDRLQRLFPDLRFQALDATAFQLPENAVFNKTHVPMSALARLATGSVIPEKYRNVLYLDGDIQVVGDISALVRTDVPAGCLLAAPDHAELASAEIGPYAREFRSYLSGLGVRPDEYFNSGVMAASRQTWTEIGLDALAFMRTQSQLCRYHDQSALNRVCSGRRLKLSPRYNLTSWCHDLNLDLVTPVSIIHFTGGAKPWADRQPASGGSYRHIYDRLTASDLMFEKYWQITSGRNQNGTAGETRGPTLLERWRSFTRGVRVRSILKREEFFVR